MAWGFSVSHLSNVRAFKSASSSSICKRTDGLKLAITGRSGWFDKPKGKDKMPGPWQTCETDYDCNPGGRNWPLRCQSFVLAKFCIDPESTDDWFGGLGIQNPELAMVPIPVRPTDGYR